MSATPAGISAPRNNHFNFLRLLLATLVLLSHAPELIDGDRHREPLTYVFYTLSSGEVAVAGFFLLSGFLIVQSWQRQPALVDFLRNRVLRIYPGFLVATLLSAGCAGAIGAARPGHYLAGLQPLALLRDAALLRLPDTPPTFLGQPYPSVNGNLWTIAYEFSCYLGVGLLGVCGVVKRRRAFLAFTLLAAGGWLLPLAGPTLVIFCAEHFNPACARAAGRVVLLCKDNWVFTHLLFVFCAGGCFALFRDRIRFSRWGALAAVTVLLPCMFSVVASQLALTTLGAYAFFTFAFARLPVLAVFQGHTDISYGVYLYGWPVQKLLLWTWPGLSPGALFVLSVAASAGAGWASWRLVEQPFLRLKSRPVPDRPDETPVLAATAKLAPV